MKTLKSFNASYKVLVSEMNPQFVSDVILTEKGIVLTDTCNEKFLTVGSLLRKLSKYSIELNVLVGNNPLLFIMSRNEDIFLITENDRSFGLLLSETVSSLLEDHVTADVFHAELSDIGITLDMVRKYFGKEPALQMEAYFQEKKGESCKKQYDCINAINEWCKDLIQKSGLNHLRPDIVLGKHSKYGIYIDLAGIMATHPYTWYNSDELARESNLIGQELIARWDEIRVNLIYQADMKNIQKQDIETFDVGAPYSRKKERSLAEENEKYVLIFSDGESIDAATYNSKKEAYANMKKAYEESYPEDQEESWADMSYLSDDSALLYLNGDGACCWDIYKV